MIMIKFDGHKNTRK